MPPVSPRQICYKGKTGKELQCKKCCESDHGQFVPLETVRSQAERRRLWEDYLTVAFVRNPWRRAESAYRCELNEGVSTSCHAADCGGCRRS